MEELDNKDKSREEIFSKAVRAGKRTYFFDVKKTKAEELYLTITESKKRFSNEDGKFTYEKHKIFLYREDFEKFALGLDQVVEFIKTGKKPVEEVEPPAPSDYTDLSFEDLKPGNES
jgi:hypothetical protein